ncbi:Queuosine biosynthesis protein [Helicobacter mustelae]|uniref:7-carboxy-7-deazaguanine synthase QueE n=1 Tax=Helicobacter mustelae TaxID=217 RepID=UPI000DFAF3DB|nr:7-carboxy-7-deazaguanine synthase QueE [Helicobacter mustelae]STP12715.1 Queuosine biosynthesis protein [Helicobacter mustelae]
MQILKISEIFYSLQGEGSAIGTPSVFVRVGLCNLRCKGFGERLRYRGEEILGCDSIYAANPKFQEEWREFESSKELISAIFAAVCGNLGSSVDAALRGEAGDFSSAQVGGDALLEAPEPLPPFDIVLTGGEPSLYFQNPALLGAIEFFLARHHRISVESNGSVLFAFTPLLERLHFTLGIKLSNSGEREQKRLNFPAIQNILDHAASVVLKFVLDAKMCQDGSALKEIDAILSQISGSYEVYLMPMGSSIETINQNIKAILPLCLKRGYKLSDRLHIRIWGNQRGF